MGRSSGLAAVLLLATVPALAEDIVVECGRPATVTIRRGDPPLGEHGPSRRCRCTVAFDGVLHVFALAPGRDPFLALESDSVPSTEDDDSGGGKTPYIEREVRSGDEFAIDVAIDVAVDLPPDSESVDVELHVEASPETDATREAAKAALQQLSDLFASKPATRDELQAGMRRIVDGLCAVDGAGASRQATDVLSRIGVEAYRNGVYAISCAAWTVCIARGDRIRPPDDPKVQSLRGNLGAAFEECGDLARAAELKTRAFESLSRTLPDDDPGLQVTRVQQAALFYKQFRYDEAVALARTAIGHLAPARAPNDGALVSAHMILGRSLWKLGDAAGAKAEFEALIATPGLSAFGLSNARTALGKVLRESGELQPARALQESVVAECERTLPEDDPLLDSAVHELATTLSVMGDFRGAMALCERRIAVLERHPRGEARTLQRARSDLGVELMMMREYERARVLHQARVDELQAEQPVDERELIGATAVLATTLAAMGRPEEAIPLQRRVDEAWSRWLGPDDPDLLSHRLNLALSLQKTGALDEARDVARGVLERRERLLPPGDAQLQRARNVSLLGAARRGDDAEAVALARGAVECAVRGISDALLVMSPREVEQVASQRSTALDAVLAYARTVDDPQRRQDVYRIAWPALETSRSAAATSAKLGRLAATMDADASAALKRAIVAARLEVARCAGAGDPAAVASAARRVDAAERTLRERFAGRLGFEPPALEAFASSLPEDAAAVSYRTYRDEIGGDAVRVLALVVRRGGAPVGVELGTRDELSAAVAGWRGAIRVDGGRGKRLDSAPRPAEATRFDATASGEALRRLAFDPLRAAIGDARRLILVLDDVLHLVPFDALPDAATGECLGDRFAIENRTVLIDESGAPDADGDLVVLAGGIDYGSGGGANAFLALPETAPEIDAIARLRRETIGADAAIERLAGAGATKARLLELAPRACFLHLATHGEFDGPADARATDASPDDAVRGFAPLALCGLALAGANEPVGGDGRRDGILTGEEIAAMDLGHCELAVLSACETNVGERRPGQGIASLQTALHAAGVRTTITSLWRVPDEATHALMVEFYRRVWVDGQPKARALWEAKRTLRERGTPVAGWAAWVLTGDPR